MNIATNNDTRAVLDGTLTGGKDVTLSADGSHVVNTRAEGGGAAKDGTGVGGALAITVADNVTEAVIGAGTKLDVSGAVSATATHHGSSETVACITRWIKSSVPKLPLVAVDVSWKTSIVVAPSVWRDLLQVTVTLKPLGPPAETVKEGGVVTAGKTLHGVGKT